MDQESLTQIQQLIAAATDSLRGDLADSKRHAGGLAEGLRHELQLVAEGFQMHLDRRHGEERSFLEEQFRETRALHPHLLWSDSRTRGTLEQRVRTIEQHLGLTIQ